MGLVRLAVIVATILCLFSSVASAQEDPHHPGSFDCSAQLNANTLFPAMAVQATSGAATTTIPAGSAPTASSPACAQYTYVQVSGTYSALAVTPKFNGPNIVTSDWDCSHSAMNYVVYNADANGVYSKAGFGVLFGRIANGTCVHDTSAFASSGTNSVTLGTARNTIVAMYSWNHNDTDFGHSGTLCSADNCYWPSKLTANGTPSVTAYYSNWISVPDGTPFQPVGQYGPSFVNKKSFRIWAFTVPYDNTLWRRTWGGATSTDWLSWQGQGQSDVASNAAGCNWLTGDGVDGDRNVVVAYVSWDGKVHVGASIGSNNYSFTWSVMNDTTDNAPVRPAIACGDGVLTLVVKKNNGTVAFKRNTKITYNHYSFAEWGGNWTTISMPSTGTLAGHQIAGGVAAAKTAFNTVTVAASEMDASFNPSNSCVMVNIVNGTAGKWGVVTSGGCRLAKFSTPAMAGLDGGGARIVVMDQAVDFDSTTTVLRTATTGNGTSWSNFKFGKGIVPSSANCLHPTTAPAIIQDRSGGEITMGSGCDGSERMSTVVIGTP